MHGFPGGPGGNRRTFVVWLLGCARELGGPADVEHLSRGGEALPNHRVGSNDRANIGGDALAKLVRHAEGAEQADEAIEGKLAVTRLFDRGDVGSGGAPARCWCRPPPWGFGRWAAGAPPPRAPDYRARRPRA